MLHTCTSRAHDKTGRSAARRFGVRAWSPVVRVQIYVRVTRTWYTRGTRVRHACDTRGTRVVHACDTRGTRVLHAWDTRALVKLPLGGTVHVHVQAEAAHFF